MRHIYPIITAVLVMGWALIGTPLQAQKPRRTVPAGYWQITESFENEKGQQKITWAFELVDDGGSTLIAVGERKEVNGSPINDRSVGILFIDLYEDGALGGTIIEAFGEGKQTELALDIDTDEGGTIISMAGFDGDGSITTKFKGQWLGKGLQTPFVAGNWQVREIVSPDNGGWDIEWKYKFKEAAGKISGKGNKAIVNGRKAYRGELNTWCQFDLERLPNNPMVLVGKGTETNYKGRKRRYTYEGWLSGSGRTFFIMSYNGDGLASLIVGKYRP